MDLGLEGVPAAVAGASRGLGFAVAMELAREGADVAICARTREATEAAAASIAGATGARVFPVAADMASREGPAHFVEAAAGALGGLQIVVANAGGPPSMPATGFDEAAWRSALQTNLLSAVRMATASLRLLRQRPWGRVLFITSWGVKQPLAGLALSNAARSGATAYAKTLAAEVAAEGITVNCLMPGYTHRSDAVPRWSPGRCWPGPPGLRRLPGRGPCRAPRQARRVCRGSRFCLLSPGLVPHGHEPPGRRRSHEKPPLIPTERADRPEGRNILFGTDAEALLMHQMGIPHWWARLISFSHSFGHRGGRQLSRHVLDTYPGTMAPEERNAHGGAASQPQW